MNKQNKSILGAGVLASLFIVGLILFLLNATPLLALYMLFLIGIGVNVLIIKVAIGVVLKKQISFLQALLVGVVIVIMQIIVTIILAALGLVVSFAV